MLAAKIEIVKIDYEKCVRKLLEHFMTKLDGKPKPGVMWRLARKLGDGAPDIFSHMISYIPDRGKMLLISELADHYQEKLTEAANKALASNEFGKNLVFGGMGFKTSDEGIFIYIKEIKVDHRGIIKNESVRKKMEDATGQYLDNSALGKRIPGIGSFLKGGVGSVARVAVSLAPEEVEKMALRYINTPKNKEKIAILLAEILLREGFVMEIGEICLFDMETGYGLEICEQDLSGQKEESVDGLYGDERSASILSEEAEEILLDALAEYLKMSVLPRTDK